ncbi:hydrolase, NUDIX family [Cellvibrio sp. BR]|uniref:NUDIX hydrolase n=1 Tax=unclassified Cellvibrio TaxID=2624793 RepID=UPI0002600F66|nr:MULTISPECIES: CoA pyrophosphatase [unclassified Cellvibrio]EIK43853.1 hydrolase, NUDIX family [Cellvibrio sp. BR]QEY13659.1 CoA pyrophosphatase [Cellvibrio sp. KY-YJ-3]
MTSWLFDGLAQQLTNTPLDPVNTPQAAVLVLISRGDNPSILFTKRAAHLRQHPGEVCFPGGMWEPGDDNLLVTAQREVREEIGLPARHIQLLGSLPQSHTRAGTAVTPFVAHFDAATPLQPSPDELDGIFMVPIADFRSGLQVREDCFVRHGRTLRVPVYHYQGYEIWGFTAAITAQLLLLIDRALR